MAVGTTGRLTSAVAPDTPAAPDPTESYPTMSYPTSGWQRAMALRIGIIPLPVYLLLLALIAAFAVRGKVSGEITVMVAVIAFGAFTCAEIGGRVPFLNKVGGASLVTIFLPSFLVAQGWLPQALVQPVTSFTKSTNFIYLFITAVVVGSILGMERRVLIGGFVRIVVPLATGSLMAFLVGGAVGALTGQGFAHAILYVVTPVMAGGVGEGAIPLAVGYAEALGRDSGGMIGQILPLVFVGNLVAIVCCGALDTYGRRRPDLTGNGRLRPGAADEGARAAFHADTSSADVRTVAAGGMLGVAVYLAGALVYALVGLPAPVAMLFLVVALKLLRAVPPELEEGTRVVFRFFVTAVTYPLLFSTAVALTPWHELVAAFHPANLAIIVATVVALTGTGFVVGRRVGLYPVEAAIVNACHSGLGGTGDVMILTAAGRMELMPFAQVATRIGGALTVTLAIVAMNAFKVA